MESVKNQSLKSVFWSAVDRFAGQGLQFLIGIILARLLLPSDYGLIAMLTIFLAVADTFVQSGFSTALIQKTDRTETDFSTTFYFNVVVAILLYLILFLLAPFIADFYNEPKLVSILRVVGVTLIINATGLVQWAKLTIALDFKKQAIGTLCAVSISGIVGVVMAYKGYGVWALVSQVILNNITFTLILWTISHWHPKLVFSMKSFKSLFSFGSKLLFSSLLHTIYINLYTLVIGKKFASRDLGYFVRSNTFAQFPSINIAEVIVRAVFPIQCKMQNENGKLIYYSLQYLRFSCYVIFPIMIGLCVLAHPFIYVILGEKWLPSVPFLQLLSIAYMWNPIMKMNVTMLNVKGRSDYMLRAEIIKKIVAVLILIASIPFGIKVMCIGLILYSFADIFIVTRYTKKLVDFTLFKQIKALLPIFLISAAMGIFSYGASFLFKDPFWKLFIGTLAGILFYGLVSWIFRFRELISILSLISRKKSLSDL